MELSRDGDSDPAPEDGEGVGPTRAGQDAAELVHSWILRVLASCCCDSGGGTERSGGAGCVDGTRWGRARDLSDRADGARLPKVFGAVYVALAGPTAGGDDSQRRPKPSDQSLRLDRSRCAAAASACIRKGASLLSQACPKRQVPTCVHVLPIVTNE